MFSSSIRLVATSRHALASRQALVARPFQTSSRRLAQKGAQDKDSLNPESNEYNKTGSDQSAAQSDAAFDPQKTRPEQEQAGSGQKDGGDAVDVSPANKDVSKRKGAGANFQEGSAAESGGGQSERARASGGGRGPKSGGGS